MPTRIELLRQAGFSDAEIGDWATAERRRMQQAGFSDSAIDDEFGVTRPPPEVPAAFVERLRQGNALQRILGAARDYAKDYFGDEPLGPSPESTRFLRKFGVFGDLSIPVATISDAALRGVTAGIAGLGAAAGQAVEESRNATLGPGPEAKGKAARDTAQLAQIAAMFLGTGPKGGAIRVPAARVASRPVIALPRGEDFRNAAAAISGTPANFGIEQKLLRLWTDHGVHPNEVAEDALRDRTIGEALRSDSEKLPDVYVGTNATTTATGAPPSGPAQLGDSAQAYGPSVPPESEAAPVEATERSSANLDASEPARMTAGSEGTGVLIDPPRKRQRPFVLDYPQYQTDARGRLLRDIEGRLLGAKFIAGRRFSGKADERLSPDDIKNAIRELNIPLRHPDPGEIEDRAGGEYSYRSVNPPFGKILINPKYESSEQDIFIAHELGHAIDDYVGDLSATLTQDEIFELRDVYSDLRGGAKKGAPRLQPEDLGYSRGLAANMELVADGVRAYMRDPNYFKTVAPKSAVKFRKFVNESPLLKKVIQLNSLGAIGLTGAGTRSQDRNEQ